MSGHRSDNRPCCAHSRDAVASGAGTADASDARSGATRSAVVSTASTAASRPTLDARVRLPGGVFRRGTDAPTFVQDGEGPVRRVRIPPFAIDGCAVRVARFAAFVDATGYVTDSERFG